MLAVDTTESLKLEGSKHQYKRCGKLEGTTYFQSSANRLLGSDQAGCDVDVDVVTQFGSILKRLSRAATVEKDGLKGVTDL